MTGTDVLSATGSALAALAARENRAALVGYLPVGYPSVPGSVAAVRTMIDAGVDVVELGMPYSDPVMDGPVIQHAVEAALAPGLASGTRCSPSSRCPAVVRPSG